MTHTHVSPDTSVEAETNSAASKADELLAVRCQLGEADALGELVEREVLTLFYLRELDLRQVAEVLEVPVGTVKSRLFRARKLLRSLMETQREGVST